MFSPDRGLEALNDSHIVAIDAGTGSGRCVIFDLDGGQIAVASREWSHATIPTARGSRVFDTERNWGIMSLDDYG
jgi:autoinducer 2 (AI-2) kinase